MAIAPASVDDVDAGLRAVGYLPGESTSLVAYLAARLGKPVLVEGPAGVGKTELAKALAAYLDRTLVRLQCYEGLDEAKALYEWNYRKQLLRIQAEAAGTGWDAVQDDIFGEEFLLARPLMTAIASEQPVVLLIDEIDKTDQEFEAMLLELLSDFQISIPELGRIEARTHPVVLLTSNNSRELTEALKRRCLYLWLDYPRAERELAIVRLHAPELPDAVAAKLVEVDRAGPRPRPQKPPSIAESIDWARALLLLGAEDIDEEMFRETMCIIVKHRTDLDVVAERVGVRLGARRGRLSLAARIVDFAEALRAEGVAVGTSELLDAFAALDEVPWTDRAAFREALAATLAKSPRTGACSTSSSTASSSGRRRRRRWSAACASRAPAARAAGAASRSTSTRSASSSSPPSGRATTPRCATSPASPSPRWAAAARAPACSAWTCSGSAARSACGRTAPAQEDEAGEPLTREQIRRFEAHLRRELERAQIERTGTLPPARPLNELDRALPSGPLQDLAAVHRVVAQLKRRLATQGREARGRRTHAHVDVRRTLRASLQTGGVPAVLKYRPQRPRRPELYVLCDVSTSVTSASVFFLSVLHALHDAFRRMRSFVFVERISEVTALFERERSFQAVSEAIGRDAGVADVSGYTDYGRVWNEFLTLVEDDLHPRATVIVLGDARTNGRDPRADAFARDRRPRRPDVLAQPRAAAVLELRRLRGRAPTRRSASCTSAGRPRSSRTSSRR